MDGPLQNNRKYPSHVSHTTSHYIRIFTTHFEAQWQLYLACQLLLQSVNMYLALMLYGFLVTSVNSDHLLKPHYPDVL